MKLAAIAAAVMLTSVPTAAPHAGPDMTFSLPPRAMIFIGISNHERSLAFYRDVLGLKLVADSAQAVVFDAHGTELRLTFPPKVQPAAYTVFGLAVSDIETSVAALGRKNIVFERYGFPKQAANGVMTFPNGDKVAWFKDPDGNLLSLAQFPAKMR